MGGKIRGREMKRIIVAVFIILALAGCDSSQTPSTAVTTETATSNPTPAPLDPKEDRMKTEQFYHQLMAVVKEADFYNDNIKTASDNGDDADVAGAIKTSEDKYLAASTAIDGTEVPALTNKDAEKNLKDGAKFLSGYCYSRSVVCEKAMDYQDDKKVETLVDLKKARDDANSFSFGGAAAFITALSDVGFSDKEIKKIIAAK
jgi:hypothetical protein